MTVALGSLFIGSGFDYERHKSGHKVPYLATIDALKHGWDNTDSTGSLVFQ